MLGRPRYTVNQDGAPEPETNEGTITIGRQAGEKTDAVEKPATKSRRQVVTVRGRAGLALRQITTNLLHATDGRDVLFNSPDGWEVEQPWLWWLGPNGNSSGGGPFGHPIPGANPIGVHAGIPAVHRATGLIVDTLATLPWHVYRNSTENGCRPRCGSTTPTPYASTAGSSTPPA